MRSSCRPPSSCSRRKTWTGPSSALTNAHDAAEIGCGPRCVRPVFSCVFVVASTQRQHQPAPCRTPISSRRGSHPMQSSGSSRPSRSVVWCHAGRAVHLLHATRQHRARAHVAGRDALSRFSPDGAAPQRRPVRRDGIGRTQRLRPGCVSRRRSARLSIFSSDRDSQARGTTSFVSLGRFPTSTSIASSHMSSVSTTRRRRPKSDGCSSDTRSNLAPMARRLTAWNASARADRTIYRARATVVAISAGGIWSSRGRCSASRSTSPRE